MSAVSAPQSQIIPTATPLLEDSTGDKLPPNWNYLLPTIGTLAAGAFFIPGAVPIGMVAGVGVCVLSCGLAAVAKGLNLITKDENSEYEQLLNKFPLLGTLVAPMLEEGLFRGLLQPLGTRTILFITPAAAAMFLGTGLSIALTVSIVAIAAMFGLIHVFNEHKNSGLQAAVATVSGIALGVISVQFGLSAAIAAHIVNNTIAITFGNLGKTIENRTTS